MSPAITIQMLNMHSTITIWSTGIHFLLNTQAFNGNHSISLLVRVNIK